MTSQPSRPVRTRLSLFIMLGILWVSLFWGGTPSFAQTYSDSPSTEVGLNIASWIATIPYGASKLVYAGLGGVIGSLAYLLTFGGDEPSTTVWEKSMLGTYVLTPEHLTGEEPIHFVGP